MLREDGGPFLQVGLNLILYQCLSGLGISKMERKIIEKRKRSIRSEKCRHERREGLTNATRGTRQVKLQK